MRALPANPRRIILLNPTRYLGNLLIAGGLIQDFAAYCSNKGITFRVVVDEAYADLLSGAFDPELLIYYPRQKIARAGYFGKLKLYLQCLRSIRHFKADIAFNIEEDSVSNRLTQLSDAAYKLGCSPQQHSWAYDGVLPIQFTNRPAPQQHRWYSFQDVFLALGLPPAEPHYIALTPNRLNAEVVKALEAAGVDFNLKLAVIHTGATKQYKLWPHASFAALATQLSHDGYQVIFMGAGKDADDISATLSLLDKAVSSTCVNLCNQLSLAQLASFFQRAALMVGNDSGPFHLSAALGLPGVVIFGPTEASLWGPLATKSTLLQDRSVCSAACSRNNCEFGYRCLPAITPDLVRDALQKSLGGK